MKLVVEVRSKCCERAGLWPAFSFCVERLVDRVEKPLWGRLAACSGLVTRRSAGKQPARRMPSCPTGFHQSFAGGTPINNRPGGLSYVINPKSGVGKLLMLGKTSGQVCGPCMRLRGEVAIRACQLTTKTQRKVREHHERTARENVLARLEALAH